MSLERLLAGFAREVRGESEGPAVVPVVQCDPKEDRCRKSEAAATDVNRIVAKYKKAGVPLPQGPAAFLDVTQVPDYQGALEQMRSAEMAFERLPARVRRRFDNDPADFLEFVLDSQNEDEMRELGILAPKAIPVVPPVVAPDEGGVGGSPPN